MARRGKGGRPDYGHQWRQLAARVRRHHGICHLCGGPIDRSLPPSHPQSFTVDHVKPVSTHPDLALRYDNLAGAHRNCNQRRGAGAPAKVIASMDW